MRQRIRSLLEWAIAMDLRNESPCWRAATIPNLLCGIVIGGGNSTVVVEVNQSSLSSPRRETHSNLMPRRTGVVDSRFQCQIKNLILLDSVPRVRSLSPTGPQFQTRLAYTSFSTATK